MSDIPSEVKEVYGILDISIKSPHQQVVRKRCRDSKMPKKKTGLIVMYTTMIRHLFP